MARSHLTSAANVFMGMRITRGAWAAAQRRGREIHPPTRAVLGTRLLAIRTALRSPRASATARQQLWTAPW